MSKSIQRVQQLIQQLPPHEQQVLLSWLSQLLTEKEQQLDNQAQFISKPNREVVEQKQEGHITYQLERVKCGKKSCKCMRGKLHGPYWYGYQRKNGKLRSWYIGKTFKIQSQ